MSWTSALRKQATPEGSSRGSFVRPNIPQHTPDWARLVSLDFETYWDQDYTLKKMSTSEYVRDPRFRVQMMGIKVGLGKTKIVLHGSPLSCARSTGAPMHFSATTLSSMALFLVITLVYSRRSPTTHWPWHGAFTAAILALAWTK